MPKRRTQSREAFVKQSKFLLENLRHPSLHAKKYDEARNLWQARVDYTWRRRGEDAL